MLVPSILCCFKLPNMTSVARLVSEQQKIPPIERNACVELRAIGGIFCTVFMALITSINHGLYMPVVCILSDYAVKNTPNSRTVRSTRLQDKIVQKRRGGIRVFAVLLRSFNGTCGTVHALVLPFPIYHALRRVHISRQVLLETLRGFGAGKKQTLCKARPQRGMIQRQCCSEGPQE